MEKTSRFFSHSLVSCSSFLLLLLSLILISSSGFAVITISSIEELQNIGNHPDYPLNGEYVLTQDIDASDTINWNVRAVSLPYDTGMVNYNIWEGFKPIGAFLIVPFTGKFNGNGYKITNLYINRLGAMEVGLFGFIGEGSEICNLGIENCYIVGESYVGGLVGTNNYGTVSNCYSTGSVSARGQTGGLVGRNLGMINRCYSICSVEGEWNVGGLVGNNGGTITQSYSTGSVTGGTLVGGLVGWNYAGTLSNCYTTSSVLTRGGSGGLVSWNDATIEHCYSAGLMIGNGKYTGGLTGGNRGKVSSSYWDIEASEQDSSVVGEGKTTTEMTRQATFVGWDFKNVWRIAEELSYPYLQWQEDSISNMIREGQVSVENIVQLQKEGEEKAKAEGEVEEEGQVEKGEGDGQVDKEGEGQELVRVGEEQNEGEASVGGEDENKGCGCYEKLIKVNEWWKYILDFILIGMLISLMSGMQQRKKEE